MRLKLFWWDIESSVFWEIGFALKTVGGQDINEAVIQNFAATTI